MWVAFMWEERRADGEGGASAGSEVRETCHYRQVSPLQMGNTCHRHL